MVSLTYRTQDLVKIDNESFELEHIFKCDRNILVLPHQFTKSVLGKVKRLTSVRQWDEKHLNLGFGVAYIRGLTVTVLQLDKGSYRYILYIDRK